MSEDKLPVLRADEIIRVLGKLGFIKTRAKGSHFRYYHPDGRRTTVPVHRGKTVGKGLLRKILKDIDISVDEFKKLL